MAAVKLVSIATEPLLRCTRLRVQVFQVTTKADDTLTALDISRQEQVNISASVFNQPMKRGQSAGIIKTHSQIDTLKQTNM